MGGGASASGRMQVYFESPPPNRRHEFRYAKCARRTFMGGGASASGRMQVYYKSTIILKKHIFLSSASRILKKGNLNPKIVHSDRELFLLN